jgi:hypothetical protein
MARYLVISSDGLIAFHLPYLINVPQSAPQSAIRVINF